MVVLWQVDWSSDMPVDTKLEPWPTRLDFPIARCKTIGLKQADDTKQYQLRNQVPVPPFTRGYVAHRHRLLAQEVPTSFLADGQKFLSNSRCHGVVRIDSEFLLFWFLRVSLVPMLLYCDTTQPLFTTAMFRGSGSSYTFYLDMHKKTFWIESFFFYLGRVVCHGRWWGFFWFRFRMLKNMQPSPWRNAPPRKLRLLISNNTHNATKTALHQQQIRLWKVFSATQKEKFK